MKNDYPDSINGLIEQCFNTIIKPSILPDPLKWTNKKALIELAELSEICIDKNPCPSSKILFKEKFYSLHFSYGQILSLFEIINLSYNVGLFEPMLNRGITQTPNLRFKKEQVKNNTFLLDYSYLLNLPSDYAFNEAFCTEVPHSEIDFAFVWLLFDYALAFICLHERAHILRGHWDYLKNELNTVEINEILSLKDLLKKQSGIHNLQKEFSPTDNILVYTGEQHQRQALESDADYWAFIELIARNTQKTYEWVYDYPFIKSKSDIIFLSSCAVSFVFLLSKRNQTVNNYFDPNSLDPSLRLYQVIDILENHLGLLKNEAERGIHGVYEILRLTDYLHDTFGIINSSKIFRFYGDNLESTIWGENALSYYDATIKKINVMRPKLKKYESRWL
ncbi:MAG: hypothetical protein JEZ09_17905 [Salinivirgaceae bacterium]|nr:hypothetical protein [Salinivirgaceae bacterium]